MNNNKELDQASKLSMGLFSLCAQVELKIWSVWLPTPSTTTILITERGYKKTASWGSYRPTVEK